MTLTLGLTSAQGIETDDLCTQILAARLRNRNAWEERSARNPWLSTKAELQKLNLELARRLNLAARSENAHWVNPIDSQYLGEEISTYPVTFSPNVEASLGVEYFSETERSAYEVYFSNRNIVTQAESSEPFSTKGVEGFAFTREGRLYSIPLGPVGKRHHSSPLAGSPASSAGNWRVIAGKVTFFSDSSGHYLMPQFMTAQLLNLLYQNEVFIEEPEINLQGKTRFFPDDVLHYAAIGIDLIALAENQAPSTAPLITLVRNR